MKFWNFWVDTQIYWFFKLLIFERKITVFEFYHKNESLLKIEKQFFHRKSRFCKIRPKMADQKWPTHVIFGQKFFKSIIKTGHKWKSKWDIFSSKITIFQIQPFLIEIQKVFILVSKEYVHFQVEMTKIWSNFSFSMWNFKNLNFWIFFRNSQKFNPF